VARRKRQDTDPGLAKLIKRYGNRKLYDTQQSRYVTLDEISQMVRRGEDIRVVDNKTQEDLTAVTLTQIMLEEQKNKHNILPLSLCKNLIQEGGDCLSEWLHKGKESLNTMRIEAEEHIARLVEKGHGTKEEGTHLLKDWFINPQKTLDLIQKKIDERIRYFFYQLTGLDELERQLQKLENQLGCLEERLARYDEQAS
jgi:polyhydroxyalkanoate synthesis repressor PhaR